MSLIINETTEMVPIQLLRPHPRNVRQGDIGAVVESIKANGFFGYLIVQKGSCHILCGNHRYYAAMQLGIPELPVVWVDVDDERALRILLADNRTSDLATYDNKGLAALLSELANADPEHGLDGTGYDGDDLDDLIKDLARSATDTTEPLKKKGEDRYAIYLICEDQGEQEGLEAQLFSMGLFPRKTILNERATLAVG